eukprot:9336331-Pyramimonas_sp.AAC.1
MVWEGQPMTPKVINAGSVQRHCIAVAAAFALPFLKASAQGVARGRACTWPRVLQVGPRERVGTSART